MRRFPVVFSQLSVPQYSLEQKIPVVQNTAVAITNI